MNTLTNGLLDDRRPIMDSPISITLFLRRCPHCDAIQNYIITSYLSRLSQPNLIAP